MILDPPVNSAEHKKEVQSCYNNPKMNESHLNKIQVQKSELQQMKLHCYFML
jgi:hypothetical protein